MNTSAKEFLISLFVDILRPTLILPNIPEMTIQEKLYIIPNAILFKDIVNTSSGLRYATNKKLILITANSITRNRDV